MREWIANAKKKITPARLSLIICILLFLGYKMGGAYAKEAKINAEKEKNYRIAIGYVCEGKWSMADAYLMFLRDYKDSEVISIFCHCRSMVEYGKPPEVVEKELNLISSEYAGPFCKDIEDLRFFIKTNGYIRFSRIKEEERKQAEERRKIEAENKKRMDEIERLAKEAEKKQSYSNWKSSAKATKKQSMPDCDDYEDFDDFMDDWDGNMPGGIDAEDYWDNW